MILIDTHTHLYSEAFKDDREEMMQRAKAQNVQQFFVPAIDTSYFDAMTALKTQFPEVIHLMMGLHPCSVQKETCQSELDFVKSELETGKYVAVGEIGVDLFWDKTTLGIQRKLFSNKSNGPNNLICRSIFTAEMLFPKHLKYSKENAADFPEFFTASPEL